MGYVMRNDARRLRNYANKPIELGEKPAFETAIPLGTSLCVKCLEWDGTRDRWGAPTGVSGPDAVLMVAGSALCAECAVKSWEG